MPYKSTRTYTRPNTDVAWWDETHPQIAEEDKQYRTDTYINTGMMIETSSEVTENGLTKTTIEIWTSKDALYSFLGDERIIEKFITPGEAYRTANNISLDVLLWQWI